MTWLGLLASVASLGAQYDAKQFDQLVGIAQMVVSLTARGFIFTSQGIYWGGDEANPAQMIDAGQITGIDDAAVELLHMLFDPYQVPATDAFGQPTDRSETESTHLGAFIDRYMHWLQDHSLSTLPVRAPPQMSTDPELAGIAEQINEISFAGSIAGTQWWMPMPDWLRQLVAPPAIITASTDTVDSDPGVAKNNNEEGQAGAAGDPSSQVAQQPVTVTTPNPPAPPSNGNPVTTSPPIPTLPPAIVAITNVQPAQRRYIGGNVGFPVGGSNGSGEGDGLTWLGIDGGDYAHPNTKGKSGTGDDGDGFGGPAKPGRDGEDPGETTGHDDVADHNRDRYGDGTSGDDSSSGSADTGIAGGSRGDDPGQQDRDRNTSVGRKDVVSGGYNDNRGYPDPIQRGDPAPDDGGGSEGRPTIPYGPRHNNTAGPMPPPNDPNAPSNVRRRYLERMLLARLGMYGYASGDDLGSAGYNPHFDPNPENTGASMSESGDGAPVVGPQPNTPDFTAADLAATTRNYGPDPDNEWGAGGYNPHYQPSGYGWTPYSKNVGSSVLQQPASRVRSVIGRPNVLANALKR